MLKKLFHSQRLQCILLTILLLGGVLIELRPLIALERQVYDTLARLRRAAAERPVVTTSIVNSGLGAVPDEQLLVADDHQSLSDHIVSLLEDGEQRRRIGKAGRRFVRENFRWEGVLDRVREIERKLGAVEQRTGSREVRCT